VAAGAAKECELFFRNKYISRQKILQQKNGPTKLAPPVRLVENRLNIVPGDHAGLRAADLLLAGEVLVLGDLALLPGVPEEDDGFVAPWRSSYSTAKL
jgi:hypothetical protein